MDIYFVKTICWDETSHDEAVNFFGPYYTKEDASLELLEQQDI